MKSDRNVLMLAVGALVPLSYGRLGKGWKHAAGLKFLAEYVCLNLCNGRRLNIRFRTLIQDPSKKQVLEDFWVQYKIHRHDESPEPKSPDSPSFDKAKRREESSVQNGVPRRRNRAVSTASALVPLGQPLSSHHPALSLPSFLNNFGPLIFPLYKAALLRKRILLVGHAPVELACNFGMLCW